MTFDELLAVVPGLRKLRILNANMLRVLLDRPRKACTWCGEPVGKGRSKWCGDRCVEAFKMRCCWATLSSFVEKRDNWICSLCGRDTKKSKSEFHANYHRLRKETQGVMIPYSQMGDLVAKFGYARGQFWEIDHIVPVSQYGGLCGPENLRLLCGACHLKVTKATSRKVGKES